MTISRPRTPLTNLRRLDDEAVERLAGWHITSVEALLGALASSADQIGELLQLGEEELEQLRREVEEALDSETLAAMAAQEGKRYPVGGLKAAAELAKRSQS